MREIHKEVPIPPQDVEKMTKVVDMVQEIYTEKGEVPVLFFLSYRDPETQEDDHFKVYPMVLHPDVMVDFIKHMIKKKDATSVIMCGEGYAVELPKERVGEVIGENGKYHSVKDHPEKKEIIFFTYENKDSFWVGRTMPQPDGSFTEIKWEPGPESSGRFTNLFPGKKPADIHGKKA